MERVEKTYWYYSTTKNKQWIGGKVPTISYKIKAGSRAFSTDGLRDWGLVPSSILDVSVVPEGEIFPAMTRIASPLWDNGKKFCVQTSNIIQVVVEDPPPPPDENAPVKTVIETADGSVYEATQFTRIA